MAAASVLVPHYVLPRVLRGQCRISLMIGAFLHPGIGVKQEAHEHMEHMQLGADVKEDGDSHGVPVKRQFKQGRPRKSEVMRDIPATGRFGGQCRKALCFGNIFQFQCSHIPCWKQNHVHKSPLRHCFVSQLASVRQRTS